jgi:hypothetical protein
VTGNYQCFLALSLLVIVGYMNLTSTCYNSILLCGIIRWIEETFLEKLVWVSCENTYESCLCFYILSFDVLMVKLVLNGTFYFWLMLFSYSFTTKLEFETQNMIDGRRKSFPKCLYDRMR